MEPEDGLFHTRGAPDATQELELSDNGLPKQKNGSKLTVEPDQYFSVGISYSASS